MLAQNLIIDAINSSPLNRGADGADWLSCQDNIPIVFDNGDMMLFDWIEPRTYKVHTFFDRAQGKEAIALAKDAFRQMFEVHDAKLLIGLTPIELRHARIFNRLIGGKSAGTRQTEFGPCEMFILSREMWKAN